MRYLPTEHDRHLIQRHARLQARAEGYAGYAKILRADVLELDFWQRWRALDEASQAAIFHTPNPSSRLT